MSDCNLKNLFRKSADAIRCDMEIDAIRDQVLARFPLLGTTMAKLKTVASDSIQTAATDGEVVYYAPKFFDTLTNDQRVFCYAHEVMHVAFNHILRSRDRNPQIWNIATDAVINQMLMGENLPIIDGGVNMADAIGRSAEEVYEKLLEQQKNQEQQNQQQQDQQKQQGASQQDQQSQQESGQQDQQKQQGASQQDQQNQQGAGQQDQPQSGNDQQSGEGQENQSQQNPESGQSQDARSQPQHNNQSQQNPESGQSQDAQSQPQHNNQSQSDDGNSGDNNQQMPNGPDNHQIWDDAVRRHERQMARSKPSADDLKKQLEQTPVAVQEKDFSDKNRAERERIAEEMRRVLDARRNQVSQDIRSEMMTEFGDVGRAPAVMDWRRVLKKSLAQENDRWSYRRSSAGNDYMPRVEELDDEDRAETEVLLDVSGSVSDEFLRHFLRQLRPLLRDSDLRVGCFSDEFYPFVDIKSDRDINTFRIPPCGGTDWDLAVRSFSKRKNINKIVFTDGEAPGRMPRSDLRGQKIIWLVWGRQDFQPVCGRVIRVGPDMMSRMITQNHTR